MIGILLGSGLGAYVIASTSTIAPTLSAGVFPGAPSLTVWAEGTDYFAKNASGVTVYSGTNASQIILDTLNQASDGDVLLFKNGRYSITFGTSMMGIQIFKAVTIEGEGWNTIFSYDSGFSWGMFQTYCNGVTIRDLAIDGNKEESPAWHGIYGIWVGTGLTGTNDVTIQNVYIFDTYLVGICVDINSNRTRILNCKLENISSSVPDDPAIRISEKSNDALIEGNTIINGYEEGIRTYSDGSFCSQRTRIIANCISGTSSVGILTQGSQEVISANTLENLGSNSGGAILVDDNGYLANLKNGTSVNGNTIKNIVGFGIKIAGSLGVSVQGNTIINTSKSGIFVYSSNLTTVSANTVNQVSDSYQGVLITGTLGHNATGNIISGNTFFRIYYATFAPEYTDYNIVIANVATEVGAGGGNAWKRNSGVDNHGVYEHNQAF